MSRGILGCSLVLCCGLLFASGCAKEEVVKKDESIAATTKAPQPPVTTPAPVEKATPPVEAKPAETTPKEVPATVKEEPVTTGKASLQELLEKIYFDFDSADLSAAARDGLKKNSDLLKKNGSVKIQIEGHCDERGSDEYNLALGERRAKSAMKYLVTLGVKADRLSTISYGKEKPADPGHDEAAWAKNRRDEFVVTK
ncbi:MAG TPA: peptidoglycan-associated lipoprotein Pal [Geobacteraceae bacterium]